MISDQEDNLNVYKMPIHSKANHTRQSTSQKKSNGSLPSITFPKKEKVNTIRRQIDTKKIQIDLLKARIHSLKYEKSRNEKKKKKNEQQIQFIKTIQQRFRQDKQHKEKLKQIRQYELQDRKREAAEARDRGMYERQLSKSIVKEKNTENASKERKKKKQIESQIKFFKSQEIQEKKKRAKQIKKYQFEVEEKMKTFHRSKVEFARRNRENKINETIKQRKKVNRTLNKLKSEEQLMIEDCKKSQVQMMQSLYELNSVQPERKRKGARSRAASINSFKFY